MNYKNCKYKIGNEEFPVKNMGVREGRMFIEIEDGRIFWFENTEIKYGGCYIDSEHSCPEEWFKKLGIK